MFSPVFSLTDISHLILILSHGLGHTTSTPSFVKKQYITLKKLLLYSEFFFVLITLNFNFILFSYCLLLALVTSSRTIGGGANKRLYQKGKKGKKYW